METKTETEIVLREDGKIIQRDIVESEKNVSEEMIQSLCSDVSHRANKIFNIKGVGDVDIVVRPDNQSYCIIHLSRLPLKAPYKMNDGILSPEFNAPKEPVMPLFWTAPDDMKLVMLVMLNGGRIKDQWLFAFDGDKRAYRLPVGNLYDDCRLCNGEFQLVYQTALDAVTAEIQQLEKGQWNADLNSAQKEAMKLFRFKPLNDKFEQLPPDGEWTTLCRKVSPAILKFIL